MAVPLVVVRQGTSATLLHRQPGLGAVERLYLRLLVDREHNGVGRRVDVKADDFAQFGDELRVLRQLEPAHPVRSQPVRLIRCTEETLMPTVRAIRPAVQCVVSSGGSSAVRAITAR